MLRSTSAQHDMRFVSSCHVSLITHQEARSFAALQDDNGFAHQLPTVHYARSIRPSRGFPWAGGVLLAGKTPVQAVQQLADLVHDLTRALFDFADIFNSGLF